MMKVPAVVANCPQCGAELKIQIRKVAAASPSTAIAAAEGLSRRSILHLAAAGRLRLHPEMEFNRAADELRVGGKDLRAAVDLLIERNDAIVDENFYLWPVAWVSRDAAGGWLITVCPLCDGRHGHGDALGHKVAHCVDSATVYYVLVERGFADPESP